jgi:hypothetical protein
LFELLVGQCVLVTHRFGGPGCNTIRTYRAVTIALQY